MSKEKLRHATIIEALSEYKKTIDSSTMYNEKDVQETIYQIEDLANSKAVIYNKNSKPDVISGNIIIESYDVYKMFKSLSAQTNSPVKAALLDSTSNVPVRTTVSLRCNESWDKIRRTEEIVLTLIDTLRFIICDIPDTYLSTLKININEEVKRRKEIDVLCEK